MEYLNGNRIQEKRNIFFELHTDAPTAPLPTLNYAVLAVLFSAMKSGRTIVVDGPVSRRFLENIEEFQQVFASWTPERYRVVDIVAQKEVDDLPEERKDAAVCAFSGGVDASFTVYRHLFKRPGKFHQNLRTAVLVHGWDIAVEQSEAFKRATDASRRMLDGTGIGIATMRTNGRKLLPRWSQNFGAGLGSILHQFAGNHDCGLIGSDEPYSDLVLPLGSNPISNPLMSSGSFRILTDGCRCTRSEKIAHIADWQRATDNIRVCWEGPTTGANCCKCEKCIRTIMNFRALGVSRPGAFPADVRDEQIRGMRALSPVQLTFMTDILRTARKNGVQGTWVGEVEELVRRHNTQKAS
ncbi:hypothetical protein VQH23_00515 [Pararoseomonas sp. SCSIO 73927]|uniref:hypothetical protein n=1 Tax=Pararoseomonas sp. SCSIO 73927 TaxID=3114537 RepID=UPI0030D44AFB